MKNLYIVMALVAMPLVMGTVLQPDIRFNDLVMRQEAETKALNQQLNTKYQVVLAKKDLLERSNDYSNATKLLYERYRKEPHAGPHAIEKDIEALREKFSPGLNASLKRYNDELTAGKEKIADKYAQMRKSIAQK